MITRLHPSTISDHACPACGGVVNCEWLDGSAIAWCLSCDCIWIERGQWRLYRPLVVSFQGVTE